MIQADELEDALGQLWKNRRPKASGDGETIAVALEARYGVRLPDEFRRYVTEVAPAEDWDDSTAVSLWAAGRIVSLRDACGPSSSGLPVNAGIEAEADQYLVFACFADWCGYAYGICCSDGENRGKVAMVGVDGGPNRLCALSLASFIRLVAENSMRIHSPGGDGFTDIV